jgi:hypothetical protein
MRSFLAAEHLGIVYRIVMRPLAIEKSWLRSTSKQYKED